MEMNIAFPSPNRTIAIPSYFPLVPSLEAKKEGIASWVWSSLLEGKNLILRGAHWQILSRH